MSIPSRHRQSYFVHLLNPHELVPPLLLVMPRAVMDVTETENWDGVHLESMLVADARAFVVQS